MLENSERPFIYGGEIYVDLGDLSDGLDLDCLRRGHFVLLSSKGKIDKNVDSSDQVSLFQDGYELISKKNIIENLGDEIRDINGKGPSYLTFDMDGVERNIRAGFNGVDIYLDGKKLELGDSAILYGGDVYVGIEGIASYLYITPDLSRDKKTLNISANGVLIPDRIYKNDRSLLSILRSRHYLADIKRSDLEKERYMIQELKLPYGKIYDTSGLERYLNKHFRSIRALDWEIDLSKHSNWIKLDISFPNKNNLNWYRLTRYEVESFIWDIYTSIVNLYDEDALLSGSIKNPNYQEGSKSSHRDYVSFYLKDDDLVFDFSKSRLSDDYRFNPGYLMEILNIKLNSYGGIDFLYETSMTGEDLELTIHPNKEYFKGFSLERQINYLRALRDEIITLYPSLGVNGRVVYPDEKLDSLDFYIEKNRIRSRDLLDRTEEYLNYKFGHFSYGNDDFALDYSIYEKDLKNFTLTVVGDFSIHDKEWENAGNVGKSKLDNNVDQAISYIFSFWDANISTEVYDKEGNIVSEFEMFNENLSLVTASPDREKELSVGDRVYLISNSEDSKVTNIYYTLDGTKPTTSSTLYTGMGIEILEDTTIKAFNHSDIKGGGPISTFRYKVKDE